MKLRTLLVGLLIALGGFQLAEARTTPTKIRTSKTYKAPKQKKFKAPKQKKFKGQKKFKKAKYKANKVRH